MQEPHRCERAWVQRKGNAVSVSPLCWNPTTFFFRTVAFEISSHKQLSVSGTRRLRRIACQYGHVFPSVLVLCFLHWSQWLRLASIWWNSFRLCWRKLSDIIKPCNSRTVTWFSNDFTMMLNIIRVYCHDLNAADFFFTLLLNTWLLLTY